ncbi:hypothetical protein [Chryseobacterium sp. SIMBA_029]|uniref:hypothetical protein n=1 Tax=Chryseobacterium sp. SIMBA_029 TaxID=3085772 RepID=UPI00397C5CFA
MKYSFSNKRIFCILLFYFSVVSAQKVTFINNTNTAVTIKNGDKEINIQEHEKKELADVTDILMLKEIDRSIYLFLEPTEKLTVTLEKGNKLHYAGNRALVYEYINGNLNADTYGKFNDYVKAVKNKNIGELAKYSELLLIDILRNIKQTTILPTENDSYATKKMKSYIKYNWLMTVFSAIDSQNYTSFSGNAFNYFKKYIEADIPQYRCVTFYQYSVLENLARYNNLLEKKLPTYPIIEHTTTERDNINQFLPKTCQKYYFSNKYEYLNHLNSPEKEYYKKILNEKFNDQ